MYSLWQKVFHGVETEEALTDAHGDSKNSDDKSTEVANRFKSALPTFFPEPTTVHLAT